MRLFISGTSFKREYGGPAVSVAHLASALADCGVQVGLWAPDGSALDSGLMQAGRGGVTRLAGSLKTALETFGRPDVVHDNGLWLPHNHRIAVMALQLGITRVVSVRGMLEPWAIRQKRLKKVVAWQLYQKRDLRRAAFLHATAESEAAAIRASGIDVPISIIPNGADLPQVKQSFHSDTQRNRTRIALFLSRIHPKKGLPILLEAWAKLRPEGWRLQIAGPDECGHLAEVKALVARYGLSDMVSFVGPISGSAKAVAFTSADFFVLPTHSENFGIVVAEALSHGLPVLTTQSAPWQELITERCGWWVAASAEGLLEGLRAATTTSPQTLVEMGQRGRELVATRFSWELISRQFLTTYHEAIARNQTRGT